MSDCPQKPVAAVDDSDIGQMASGFLRIRYRPHYGAADGEFTLPWGPFEKDPHVCMSHDEHRSLLHQVLDGIELGAWDEFILEWLSRWDSCTVVPIADWIWRARTTMPLSEPPGTRT